MNSIIANAKLQAGSFISSYAQVFFSDNRWFAALLLLVSFIDRHAGLAGALSVLVGNFAAAAFGFNPWLLRKGYYGFNGLLVGLGFGLAFQPGWAFYVILIVVALLTFMITAVLQGILYKYGLPYLSVPFLLGIWLVNLSAGEFSSLGLSARGVYFNNELFLMGGKWLVDAVAFFDQLIHFAPLRTYLYSLGAIFFQYNMLSGAIIAIGLLIYSRIAFTLSVVGFALSWLFYRFTGADINQLGYSFIGFNYILTSIALGGFFILPSRWSFAWLILLLPMVVVITVGLQKIFSVLQLGIYALPFNLMVLTFLYVLKLRRSPGDRIIETPLQHFSPEKNLYHHHANQSRFYPAGHVPLGLPVLGEWKISQGYQGDYTHKGEWSDALDFIMIGQDGQQFRGKGYNLKDYYCYEKPVIASADGVVADVLDGIPDNPVGDSNLLHNWGNSVVVKHTDHLYTKVSHLIPGSIRVKSGDRVKKGDLLGLCGNSGRSPYPHLHFQVQSTPHIGSQTIAYPLSDYLVKREGELELRSNDIPAENELVSHIQPHSSLLKAYHFIPGLQLNFLVKEAQPGWLNGPHTIVVKTDEYNQTYLECSRTGATAWLYNSGKIHYFTHYSGTRKSLLYYIYLSSYKVISAYYPNLIITDNLPVNRVYGLFHLLFQDFVAPFHFYLKAIYELNYVMVADDLTSSNIQLQVKIDAGAKALRFVTNVNNHRIDSISVSGRKISFIALCEAY